MDYSLKQNFRASYYPLAKEHAVGATFFLVVLLLLISLIYSTLTWMWDEKRLPLSKIVLQGDLQYVSAQDVQQAFAKMDHIGTFMSQNVDDLQTKLQLVPWVASVSIRKQWPDTIKVFLTEHQATAIWNGIELLNDQGVIFNGDVGALREDKVKLYGPNDASELVLDTWRETSPKLAQLGLKITSVVLNDRRAWQFILDNGIRLEMGKDSLEERVDRFIQLYQKLGDETQRVSYIDLRYDTGAAIGWFPEQELEESIDD